MSNEHGNDLTMEEVLPGSRPNWLITQWRAQMENSSAHTRGGPFHILTIHPTEAARRQTLDLLARGAGEAPIDRENHHTLDSLVASLHAELRQPRRLNTKGPYSVVLHEECSKRAKRLEFPLMHSLPDHHWGKGKTRDIASLSRALSEEEVSADITPDLVAFRRMNQSIAEKLGYTHPDSLLLSLVEKLEERGLEEIPFALSRVDGILLLDHPPTLSGMRERFILALNRFKPVHVLANKGSYRLGVHGFVPLDIAAVKSPSGLADWVSHSDVWTPRSETQEAGGDGESIGLESAESAADSDSGKTSDGSDSGKTSGVSSPIRMLVPRRERMIESTHALLDAALSSDSPPESILVVDPALEANHGEWSTVLDSLGIRLPDPAKPLISSPGVHWLVAITQLPHNEDSWSLPQLRSIAIQRTLWFKRDWWFDAQHPTSPELTPRPDVDILEGLARGFHILPGQGALFRWLRAASRKPMAGPYQDEEKHNRRCEANQWWLLSLANRLKPLLSKRDADALADPAFRIGCWSGEVLPLPEADESGDAWLSNFASMLRWDIALKGLDGKTNATVSGLQGVFTGHSELRKMQRVLGNLPPSGGLDWVVELTDMIEGMTLPSSGLGDSGLLLVNPNDALGCSADLVILTNLDSESWNTSPPTIPGLSENLRAELGVLPPDSRLREARHVWNHLLRAGGEVIVLDAAKDEDSQPSAPLAEWIATNDWNPASPPVLPSFITPQQVSGLYGDVNSRWGIETLPNQGAFPAARPSEVVDRADGQYGLVVTGSHPRDRRQRSGIEIHASRNPTSAPLNPASPTIPLDVQLVKDRIDRTPHHGREEHPYLDPKRKGELLTIDGFRLQPYSYPPKVTPPRNHPFWPTIGLKSPKKNAMSVDPRPLSPDPTGIEDHDLRHGFSSGPRAVTEVWSPSRLTMWLSCPRKGWLSTRLRAEEEDAEDDDVDARTRGQVIHDVWAEFLCNQLGSEVGEERQSLSPTNLRAVGKPQSDLKGDLLQTIDEKAPWLRRADAVATTRRLDLVGLHRDEYEAALSSGDADGLAGRFDRLLQFELTLENIAIAAIEWPLTSNGDKKGIEVTLPETKPKQSSSVDGDDTSSGQQVKHLEEQPSAHLDEQPAANLEEQPSAQLDEQPAVHIDEQQSEQEHTEQAKDSEKQTAKQAEKIPKSLRVRGTIDRVEVIPHPGESAKFVDEDGEDKVCPLDLDSGEEWRAKRLVIIRDLKSVEGPMRKDSGRKHQRELLEGVQLALYARIWELTHPGDRVVGVGISEIGEEPGFFVEADPDFTSHLKSLGINEVGCTTEELFRRPSETHETPTSNSFRAWMRHRITAAVRINQMSAAGQVVATPSQGSCSFCQVKDVCGLASTVGGDKKWN